MKRYYFTRTESEIIEAETEADARIKLGWYWSDPESFVLESVEDA